LDSGNISDGELIIVPAILPSINAFTRAGVPPRRSTL